MQLCETTRSAKSSRQQQLTRSSGATSGDLRDVAEIGRGAPEAAQAGAWRTVRGSLAEGAETGACSIARARCDRSTRGRKPSAHILSRYKSGFAARRYPTSSPQACAIRRLGSGSGQRLPGPLASHDIDPHSKCQRSTCEFVSPSGIHAEPRSSGEGTGCRALPGLAKEPRQQARSLLWKTQETSARSRVDGRVCLRASRPSVRRWLAWFCGPLMCEQMEWWPTMCG